jgi:uncharacterized repeat protein (TIGR03803 family)
VAAILALAGQPICPARADVSGNHAREWNFAGGLDGSEPRGDLLTDSLFNLYATLATGGSAGDGAIVMIVPAEDIGDKGTATTLYSFTGGSDGSLPSAGLIPDAAGNLYGTTTIDGAMGGGTVFELSPPVAGESAWTEQTLWSFGAPGDGANPVGSLVADAAGNLYGTTTWGGTGGQGTVFELSLSADGQAWTETVLWSFTGGVDGANPVAGLVFDASGALYGTTKAGASAGVGTVFQLSPPTTQGAPWTETTLWTFSGGQDGASPTGTLLPDGQGGFFGTAQFGGGVNPACDQARFPYYGEPDSETEYAEQAGFIQAGGNGCGVVFDLSPPQAGQTAWTQTIEWQFQGALDGANPVAGVVADPAGNLYGYAPEYGQRFWGVEYKLLPTGMQNQPRTLQTLTSFDGKSTGVYPRGTPIFGLAGRLYGTNTFGGLSWVHIENYGFGTVFTSEPSHR